MKQALLLIFVLLAGITLADPPKFPEPYDSEKSPAKPMPAAEAAKGFKMPPGFTVEVFASEPDVRNPIAMCWDTKGRLWIAENYTYAESAKKFDLSLRDRVIIFHDKDGDGKPDERKVFIDTVQRLTSVEVGLGGVWLMCPPQLLFVPDKNRDDIPDGPPEVVLEGFDVPADNYHNFANGLKWGPDGWLYGRCGASAPGNVRRPDQGPEQAVPLAGGIWRYHPHRKVFEALCHGTTNPWGHDWNEYGECFFVNSVNGHVWHMIPGAHYRRPHTISPNPFVYEPMEMIADHWHFDIGKGWNQKAVNDSRNVDDVVDKLGGGHAHIGCMIYNGDQWPKEYRGKLLTLNLHGRRINVERLERKGSSYVAKHEPDIFQASDPFFRGIDLSEGPDGSVYVIDWSDTGECHEHNGVHRGSGRIYRIFYGERKKWLTDDMESLSDLNIIKLIVDDSSNECYKRLAKKELSHRFSRKGSKPSQDAIDLIDRKSISASVRERYNALSALHLISDCVGSNYYSILWHLFHDDNEIIRAQSFSFMLAELYKQDWEWPQYDSVISKMSFHGYQGKHLAEILYGKLSTEKSNYVKLRMASEIQRMHYQARLITAEYFFLKCEDISDDDNISKMIWYGLIPIALESPEKLAALAGDARVPLIRKWSARRFAEILLNKPLCLEILLSKTSKKDEIVRRDVILGMAEGLAGVRKTTPPAAWKDWPKQFSDAKINELVRTIEVIFGDGRALDDVKKLALDDKADLEQRKAAVRTLIDANPPDLKEICEKLVKVRFLNVVAVKGLAKFEGTEQAIVKAYGAFHPSERGHAIEALCSRPDSALVLLGEIGKGVIQARDVSAAQARTIRDYDRPELTVRLGMYWGEVRTSPREKQDLMAKLKADLTAETMANADKPNGRMLFEKNCGNCHKLFGVGAEIGPDLTGAQRKDLDYLLNNIIDPSAVLTKDFQMTTFNMKDGRTLHGIIITTTPKTLTVQMEKEKVVLAIEDIERRKPTTNSLMPDGLLQPLKPQEVRDIIAYLQSGSQVEKQK